MALRLWHPCLDIPDYLGAHYFLRDNRKDASDPTRDTGQLVLTSNLEATQWSDGSKNAKHLYQPNVTNAPLFDNTQTNLSSDPSFPVLFSSNARWFTRNETLIPVEIYSVCFNNGNGFRDTTGFAKPTSSGADRIYFQSANGDNKCGIALYDDAGNQYSAQLPNFLQGRQAAGLNGELLDSQVSTSAIVFTRHANTTNANGPGTVTTATGPGYPGQMTCKSAAVMSGYYNGNIGDFFLGELAEQIELIKPLPASLRDTLRGYAAWNCKLQTASGGILPSGHPNYSSPPMVDTAASTTPTPTVGRRRPVMLASS